MELLCETQPTLAGAARWLGWTRQMQEVQPSIRTLLDAVPTRARLFEVARHFGVAVPQKGTKAELTAALAGSDQLRLRSLIEWFGRDELRKACELHGLDSSSRARQQLAARLLEAFGAPESAPPAALFGAVNGHEEPRIYGEVHR